MMKLYDRKDIGRMVQNFNQLAPSGPIQRAMFLIDIAQACEIPLADLVHEIARVTAEKRLQENIFPQSNVVVLPRIPYKD